MSRPSSRSNRFKYSLSGPVSAGLLCLSLQSASAQLPESPAGDVTGSTRDTVRVDRDPLARRSATQDVVFGRIVSLDENRLTIREGEGDAATESEYRLSPKVRVYQNDRELDVTELSPSSRVRFQRSASADDVTTLYVVSDIDRATGEGEIKVVESESAVGFGMILTSKSGQIHVVDVRNGSPAEDAGVQAGDQLISLNDRVLLKPEDVFHFTAQMEDREQATVTVQREKQDLKLTLRARNGEQARDAIHTQASPAPTKVVDDDDTPSASTEAVPPVELGATLETTKKGIAVVRVDAVSPLTNAGIRAGDYIKSADGESVLTPDGLFRVLNRFDGGDAVELGLMRGEQEMEFDLVVPDGHERVPEKTSANHVAAAQSAPVRGGHRRIANAELLEQILLNQRRQQAQLNYLQQAIHRLAQSAGVNMDDLGAAAFGLFGAVPASGTNSNCFCATVSTATCLPVMWFTLDVKAVVAASRGMGAAAVLHVTRIVSQSPPAVTEGGLEQTEQNPGGFSQQGAAAESRPGVGIETNPNAYCFCPIAIDVNGNPVLGVTQLGVPVAVVSTDANGNPILAETTLPQNGQTGDGENIQTSEPGERVPTVAPARPTFPLK